MAFNVLTAVGMNRGMQYANPGARALCSALNISAPRLIQRVPQPNWYMGATHVMSAGLPRQIAGTRPNPVRGMTFDFGDALNQG